MHFLELFKHPYIGEVNLSITQQPRYIIFVIVKLRMFHHSWHIIVSFNERIIVNKRHACKNKLDRWSTVLLKIEVDVIGLPSKVAKRMTFEEQVTDININRLQKV